MRHSSLSTAMPATILLLHLTVSSGSSIATAQGTHTWNNANGGAYGTITFWTPIGTPSPLDTARFNLASDYTVSFVSSEQARLLQVTGGNVAFEGSGIFAGDRTYTLEDVFISNLGNLTLKRGTTNNRRMHLTSTDDFSVRGSLTVSEDSELMTESAVIDSGSASSVAELIVTGFTANMERSTWRSGGMVVGTNDRGKVQIEDGAVARLNGLSVIGQQAGSEGELVVSGRNGTFASSLSSFGNFRLGDAGNGTLRVEAGASASTPGAILGFSAGGRGTATVGSAAGQLNSRWSAGTLEVRRGDVNVNQRSEFNTDNGTIIGSAETSRVNVVGDFSGGLRPLWRATGTTTISDGAEAALNVEQGGSVIADQFFVGRAAGSIGRINVSSSNASEESRVAISGDLYLGGDDTSQGGFGFLNLFQNADVNVEGNITIYAEGNITMNSDSSTLVAREINNESGGFFDLVRGNLRTRRFLGDLTNERGVVSPASFVSDGVGAGLLTITGDYIQQDEATLLMEIDGNLCGIGYDHVDVAGMATLDGDLELAIIGAFIPQINDTFNLLTADSLLGQFDNAAPGDRLLTSDGEGSFVVNYGATSPFDADHVVLSDFRLENMFPGDFDGNEFVNGNDFLVWQRTDGTPEGLAAWEANFGMQAPALAATTAVPEPATCGLVLLAAAIAAYQRRTR